MSRLAPHLLDARLRAARSLVWVASGVLVGTYFRTQIIDHSRYDVQSRNNRLRPITQPAPRGIITDRHSPFYGQKADSQNPRSLNPG